MWFNSVVTEFDDLITQMKTAQRWRQKIEEPLIFTAIEHSSTDINMPFLVGEMFINILTQMNFTPTDKEELLSLCRDVYTDNMTQLRILKEFDEEYQENRALWWW